ncbi:MAG: cell division/cell wall cluster transcriptional repressor MraZ [Armatimonadetes bacterium]|nr:cell division/cell wall cluster transcriptional repressor MraZ [Armatimonadota bacterium]
MEKFIPRPENLLIGSEEATIDDKGRVLVSKKKRDRLGEGFVMALGTVGCLTVYTASAWYDTVREIFEHSAINVGREQFARLILGTAEDEIKFDPQGRMVVPKSLRALAKLNSKVKIIGLGDRMEIWALEEHEKYESDIDGYGFARRDQILKSHVMMTGRVQP